MANSVELKVIVDDDGTLKAVSGDAEKAGKSTEDLGKKTDKTTGKRRQYNKVEKGVGQMTANTTKAFSKQTGVITSGIVPAYAILASNVFALTAAFNFLKRAFDVQALQDSQIAFAESTGIALSGITQRLREASDGMLGFREAAEASAIGLAKGFSPSQLEELAEGARKASTALGRDFQDAFDRLVRGASKAEPELLDELGITLRLEEATQRYADAIGKNRKELNAYERSQAVLIETQRQLNRNFGDVEAISNPFIVLSKTFEDLVKNVTGAVLPVFTAFAEIISRNAIAAVAVFGALGVSILKTIIPTDSLKETFGNFFDTQQERVDNAIADQQAFQAEIERTDQALRDSSKDAGKKAARSALSEGGKDAQKSAILQKMKKGIELTPQELGILKRSLKKAEAEYNKTGQITKGMFAGVGIAIVRDIGGAVKQTSAQSVSMTRRLSRSFTKLTLQVKKFGATLRLQAVKGLELLGKGAVKAGGLLNKALSLAGFIGIITMVIEMFNTLRENLANIVTTVATTIDKVINFVLPFIDSINVGVLNFVDGAINAFRTFSNVVNIVMSSVFKGIFGSIDSLINTFVGGLKSFLETINNLIPGTENDIGLPNFKSAMADAIPGPEINDEVSDLAGSYERLAGSGLTLAQNFADSSGLMAYAEGVQENALAARAAKEAIDALNESVEATGKNLPGIIKGIESSTDAVERGKKIAQAIRTIDIPGLIRNIRAERVIGEDADGRAIFGEVLNPNEQKAAAQMILDQLKGLESILPGFGTAVKESLTGTTIEASEQLMVLFNAAGNVTSGIEAFEAAAGPAGTAITQALAGQDITTALQNIDNMDRAVIELEKNTKILGQAEVGDAYRQQFEDLAKSMGKTTTELRTLLELIVAMEHAVKGQEAISKFLTGSAGEDLGRRIALQKTSIAIQKLDNAIQAEAEGEKKKQLERERELLLLTQEFQILSVNFSTFQRLAAAAGAAESEKAIQQIQAEKASIEERTAARIAELNIIRAANEKPPLTEAEEEAEKNRMLVIEAGRATSTAFDALSKDFAKIGPEGQLMSQMVQGASTMTSAFTEAFAIISDKGASGFDKLKAGVMGVAGALVGMGQMAKATSDMRVKQIDNEIAAEKNRDGKSKESLAKIAALEKKRDAEKRKAFEIEKKMKIAQTIMATAQGAIAAYTAMVGIPFVGPALAAAAAAAVVAFGAKQVQMIASTSFQGGGSGVSGAAPGSPSSIQAGERRSTIDLAKSQSSRGEIAYMRGESGIGSGPENFRPAFGGYRNRAEGGNAAFMVGEQGPELFVPRTAGNIVPNDDIPASGPTNVTFNISAVDAVGVEELLLEQRGNLIGMIREASNSYGQTFLEDVDTTVYTPQAGVSRY